MFWSLAGRVARGVRRALHAQCALREADRGPRWRRVSPPPPAGCLPPRAEGRDRRPALCLGTCPRDRSCPRVAVRRHGNAVCGAKCFSAHVHRFKKWWEEQTWQDKFAAVHKRGHRVGSNISLGPGSADACPKPCPYDGTVALCDTRVVIHGSSSAQRGSAIRLDGEAQVIIAVWCVTVTTHRVLVSSCHRHNASSCRRSLY